MIAVTVNEYIQMSLPKINILKIRNLLENNYQVERNIAEGIAAAIDVALQDQDTDGFATKADIKEVKNEIKEVRNEIKEVRNELKLEFVHMQYVLFYRLGALIASIGAALAWYMQFLINK